MERYNAVSSVSTDQCFPPGPGVLCVGGDGWLGTEAREQHTCEIVTRGYYTESSPINSLDRR